MNGLDVIVTLACIAVIALLAFVVGYEFGAGDEADRAWKERDKGRSS